MDLRVATLGAVGRAVYLALDSGNAATAVQICARRRLDIDVGDVDVLANCRT